MPLLRRGERQYGIEAQAFSGIKVDHLIPPYAQQFKTFHLIMMPDRPAIQALRVIRQEKNRGDNIVQPVKIIIQVGIADSDDIRVNAPRRQGPHCRVPAGL